MQEAGLDDVCTGGLSSYSLTNMVIAYLLTSGYQLAPEDAEQVAAHAAGTNGAPPQVGYAMDFELRFFTILAVLKLYGSTVAPSELGRLRAQHANI